MTTYKKPKGKSKPYTIDETARDKIKHMRESIEMKAEDDPAYASLLNKINSLDSYDENLLLAYFAYDKLSDLAKTLNVSASVIITRIKKIIKSCS